MAIEQPTENIKLTTEQLLQLDKFEKRLANLQMEITVHSNNIDGLRIENANLTNEKKYLEELKTNLLQEVTYLQQKSKDQKALILENTKSIEAYRIEHKQLMDKHNARENEIHSKEQAIVDKEKKVEANRAELQAKLNKVAQDMALIEKNRAILSDAIKSIGN